MFFLIGDCEPVFSMCTGKALPWKSYYRGAFGAKILYRLLVNDDVLYVGF